MRNIFAEKSQTYHVFIHILFGLLCGLIVSKYFTDENIFLLLLMGFIGNTLPDLDHILYYFTYGKDSEYSQIIKLFVKERHFKEIKNFLRDYHKYLTGLYSHTLLSPLVSTILTFYFFRSQKMYLTTLFLSISVHFIYDIFEDLLFFKRLNPNWYLKFNRKNKNGKISQLPYLEFLKKRIKNN